MVSVVIPMVRPHRVSGEDFQSPLLGVDGNIGKYAMLTVETINVIL